MNKRRIQLQARADRASARTIQAYCNAIVRFFRSERRAETPPAFDAETEARCREQRDRQLAYVPKVDVPQHSAVVYRWRASEAK